MSNNVIMVDVFLISNQTLQNDEVNINCPVFREYPFGNSHLRQQMLDAAKPCGHYKSLGCDYEVISPNVDHPGRGPKGDISFKPYIVQFDIGIYRSLKDIVSKSHSDWGQGFPCIGCEEESETCLELIIEAGSDATGGCAGKCGSACLLGAGYARDCLKHDTCIAYKALVLDEDWSTTSYDANYDGFCYDPDCGDEAAQAILNCYIDKNRWLLDEAITCDRDLFEEDNRAYGEWSRARHVPGFDEGPCNNYEGWDNDQGIPNKDQIDNMFDYEPPEVLS